MSIAFAPLAFAILVNLAAFGLFWYDKRAARSGKRRISERTLLMVALFGGSPGAMTARHFFRHKTRKEPFRTRLALIIVFQVALAAIGTLALQ